MKFNFPCSYFKITGYEKKDYIVFLIRGQKYVRLMIVSYTTKRQKVNKRCRTVKTGNATRVPATDSGSRQNLALFRMKKSYLKRKLRADWPNEIHSTALLMVISCNCVCPGGSMW